MKFSPTIAYLIGAAVAAVFFPNLHAAVEDNGTPEIFPAPGDYPAPTPFFWNLNGNTSSQPASPASPVFDQVVRNGSNNARLTIPPSGIFHIVLGGNADLTNPFWDTAQSWVVFGSSNPGESFNAGQSTGNFASIIEPSNLQSLRPGAGFSSSPVDKGSWSVTYNAAPLNPIPEPTTALVGMLLAAGMLRRKR